MDTETNESGSIWQPAKWVTYSDEDVQIRILPLVKRAEVKLRQNGCMLKGSPSTGHPVVILNTSSELVHLYLSAYFLIR
jgi:hypothetical protein